MCDNCFSPGELGAGSWALGELPGFPGEAQASSVSQITKGQPISRARRARDLLGAVNDRLVVHTAAFPVIWVSANVSLGRDREQSVMYKI